LENHKLKKIEIDNYKKIKLEKKIIHIYELLQRMDDMFESQQRIYEVSSRFIKHTKNNIDSISSFLNFFYDEHIKDYRECMIKKVHDEAKQGRKENG